MVQLIYNLGLIYIWNFFAYERDRKHPTTEMLESKKFFEQNKNRIEQNVLLLSDKESKETYLQCINYRITHDYHSRPKYCRKNQYFPKDIVDISDGHTVFVDCGAYNGDTISAFKRVSGNNYDKIVAFEPDKKNIESLKRADSDVIVIDAAAYEYDTELCFIMGDGSSSRISEEGVKVSAKAIDNVPQCQDASFIKMDIEGSEYQALLGAKKTISKNKPILAVCIYHSDEDMIRIIELISSWQLDYKFYIRHHAQKISETVLYAIP